jgi:hypothetical protein
MRNFLMAALAGGVLAAIGLVPDASARDYPFCIKGDIYASSVGDCSFDTYQQCLATASGRRAYCDANPAYYAEGYADRQGPVAYPRRSHRRY